ncbi:hypothetical protein MBFIL_09260 [Methanobrevibacter filiformis]|uniref:Uncharacterized protein n=1 Tax=Methanobrevibacter filiformis TaxID=55758 RepID=A0A166C4A9_9EURY|nr:hypothetical protein MBFIL_09260 [Methanobrevibacter filiformis]
MLIFLLSSVFSRFIVFLILFTVNSLDAFVSDIFLRISCLNSSEFFIGIKFLIFSSSKASEFKISSNSFAISQFSVFCILICNNDLPKWNVFIVSAVYNVEFPLGD